jgi:hypothetical protein
MFTDLLDQPRRELEAVRAQCAAQEDRIAKLEAIVATQGQQITFFEGNFKLVCAKLEKVDEDRLIRIGRNLMQGISFSFPHEFGQYPGDKSQTTHIVREGMQIGDIRLQFGSRFKNGIYVKPDPRSTIELIRITYSQIQIEFVEIFMFQPPEWCLLEHYFAGQNWKQLKESFEFMQEHPMKVFVRIVELEFGQKLSLKMPPALFFIFKHID